MRIGPYEILGELGRGGFATVYRARRDGDAREVALKVLRTGEGGPGPDEVRRFRREIEATRALDHPGIVMVLEVSPEGEHPSWVALELIEGESLAARIAREPLPWRGAVGIARDVADAVAHAHARGVLHRDLKPGNILLDREGGPHVVDFGLAKLSAHGSKLTKTGQALGTPAYMSPEQARGEISSLTPATDVWSLGCVLYEMLGGRRAFEGETDAAVVGKVLLAEPPRLRALRPDVPPGAERIVRATMGKRPSDRYGDASAIREDLDRILRGERPRARLPGAWRWRAAAAGLAVAAAATVAAVARPEPETPAVPAPAPAAPSEAEALAVQARALRGVDPRRAEALLRRALDMEPARDDWRLERGLMLWAIGEGAEARRLWSEIRPGGPEATAGQLYRGLEAFFRLEEGRFRCDEAEPDLRVLEAVPGREGRLARAALALMGERWAEAREALAGQAGWEAALLRGGVEDTDPAGDRGAAVREYGGALREGIVFAWAHYNRGILKAAQGDFAGAIEEFDRALEVDPRLARAYSDRGLARAARGDLVEAIEDFARALDVNPRDAGAYSNRGLARKAQGDVAGAIEDYSSALKLNPRLAEAYSNRGLARAAQGDLAGAIEDYGRALEVNPRDAKAYSGRGIARGLQGDLAGAIEDHGRALAANPLDAAAYYNRGCARVAQGDGAEGIEDLAKALEVAPPGWAHRKRVEESLARARAALAGQGTDR